MKALNPIALFCLCCITFSFSHTGSSVAGKLIHISKVDMAKFDSKRDEKKKDFHKRYNGDNGANFYFFRSCNRWRRTCGYKHGWGNFWWRRCLRRHGCYLYY